MRDTAEKEMGGDKRVHMILTHALAQDDDDFINHLIDVESPTAVDGTMDGQLKVMEGHEENEEEETSQPLHSLAAPVTTLMGDG